MKPSLSALPSLIIGYAAGALYFTLGMLAHGEKLKGDYWIVLIWVALVSFSIGSAIFLPLHFLVRRDKAFWNLWICGPIGALAGFGALGLVLSELAAHYMYGGQAAVIGASTFLASSLLTKKEPDARAG